MAIDVVILPRSHHSLAASWQVAVLKDEQVCYKQTPATSCVLDSVVMSAEASATVPSARLQPVCEQGG